MKRKNETVPSSATSNLIGFHFTLKKKQCRRFIDSSLRVQVSHSGLTRPALPAPHRPPPCPTPRHGRPPRYGGSCDDRKRSDTPDESSSKRRFGQASITQTLRQTIRATSALKLESLLSNTIKQGHERPPRLQSGKDPLHICRCRHPRGVSQPELHNLPTPTRCCLFRASLLV